MSERDDVIVVDDSKDAFWNDLEAVQRSLESLWHRAELLNRIAVKGSGPATTWDIQAILQGAYSSVRVVLRQRPQGEREAGGDE